MTPIAATQTTSALNWLSRAETWLDTKGKCAWIAAMILGFVIFWPIGLALLVYIIWSKQMFKNAFHSTSHGPRQCHFKTEPTGNSAFDAYREDTLNRLEEEQRGFEAFLERLRAAKDKSEFDDFMDEQAKKSETAEDQNSNA